MLVYLFKCPLLSEVTLRVSCERQTLPRRIYDPATLRKLPLLLSTGCRDRNWSFEPDTLWTLHGYRIYLNTNYSFLFTREATLNYSCLVSRAVILNYSFLFTREATLNYSCLVSRAVILNYSFLFTREAILNYSYLLTREVILNTTTHLLNSMDLRRKKATDMAGVKRSRAAHSGVLTRAHDKFLGIPFDHPDDVKRIKSTEVRSILKTLLKTEAGFAASTEEAQDFTPTDEADMTSFQEEELEVADAFHQQLYLIQTLGEQILACKTILTGLTTFKIRMDTLQDSLDSEPDRDHTTSLSRLQTLLYSLREQWEEADVSTEHALQAELDRCERQLTQQEGNVSAAKARATPSTPPLSSTMASLSTSGVTAYQYSKLPMIKVPTFNGDIMGWSTFWATFKSTVDDRPELNNSQKLNYLRQAIKDPALQLLMNSPLEGPDTYQDLVDELKDRFQKTKEIHQVIVKTVTSISSPKYTRADLRLFYDTMKTSITNLKSTSHYDIESFLSSLAYSTLPNKLQILWDQATKKQKGVLPITELLAFIKDHAETLPAPTTPSGEKTSPATKKEQPARGRNNVHTTSSSSATSTATAAPYKWDCVICKPEKHPLHLCPQWASYSMEQKLALISDNNLCSNCLHGGHTTAACRSKYRCNDCRQKHHTSIHQHAATPVLSHSTANSHQVPDALMTTAQLLLIGPHGEELKARALIDSGAGISLVTQRVTDLLNLHLEPARLRLAVAQGETTKPLQHLTQLHISPLHNRSLKMPCHPAVATVVTANLPSQPVPPVTDLPHLLGLQLADEMYNLPGPIDILLGADMASRIISTNLPRQGKPTEPIAQATQFGWTISGPVPGFGRDPDSASILHQLPLVLTKPSAPREPQPDVLQTVIPPASASPTLSQPQQLPDALLMAGEMLPQAQGDQLVKTKTCSTQDAALSPSPTGTLVDRQQSSRLSHSNLSCYSSIYSQQTILPEESDCQPPAALQPTLPTFSSAECQTPQQIYSPPTSTRNQPLVLTPAHHILGRIILLQTISAECQTPQQIHLPRTTTELSRENAPSLLTERMDTVYLTRLLLHSQPACQSLLINISMSTNRVSIDPTNLHYLIDSSIYISWLQDKKQQVSVITNYVITTLQAPSSIIWNPRITASPHKQPSEHGLLEEQFVVVFPLPLTPTENDCNQPLDSLDNLPPEVYTSPPPENHFPTQPVQTTTRSIGTLVTRRLCVFLLMFLYLTTALLQAVLLYTITSHHHLFQGHQPSFDATNYSTYEWYQHLHLTLGQSSSTTTDPNLFLLSARRLSRSVHFYHCWKNLPHLHHYVDETFFSSPTENTILSFYSSTDPTDFWKKLSHSHCVTTSGTCLNSRPILPLTNHLTGKDKLDRAVTSQTAARTLQRATTQLTLLYKPWKRTRSRPGTRAAAAAPPPEPVQARRARCLNTAYKL